MAYCTTASCSRASPVANHDSTSIIHWLLGSGPDVMPLTDSWARREAGPRPKIPLESSVSGLIVVVGSGTGGDVDLL